MDGSGRTTTRLDGYGTMDSHGHAALMLVESLLHNLIERSIINVDDALDVVATAIDATDAIADDFPARPPELERSISLLSAISQSLNAIQQGPAI